MPENNTIQAMYISIWQEKFYFARWEIYLQLE
jgi:hypothetical protein